MYQIESGIAIPKKLTGLGVSKYPFDAMEVGDSFFCPGKTSDQLAGSAHSHGKRTGRKYTVRKAEENATQGARVWRTA